MIIFYGIGEVYINIKTAPEKEVQYTVGELIGKEVTNRYDSGMHFRYAQDPQELIEICLNCKAEKCTGNCTLKKLKRGAKNGEQNNTQR